MTSTPRTAWRTGRIAAPTGPARSALLCLTLAGSLSLAGTLVPATGLTTAAAAAPAAHSPRGTVTVARQDSVTHAMRVSGYAYDAGAGQTSYRVRVSVFVNGHYARTVTAGRRSSRYDRAHHITGPHAFTVSFTTSRTARTVRLRAHAVGPHHGYAWVDRRHVHRHSTAAERIVHIARRYLGSRYSFGADGPHSFDCSGYSMFVYRKAHVAHLPHNSQAQRHAKRMHRISRAHARPGDLVFYLSGNTAYHVSIYAGHGKQYSATDPQRGVEHSRISSRHVVFATDWH